MFLVNTLNVNITKSLVHIGKLHFNMILLFANKINSHVDLIFLAGWEQEYATILSLSPCVSLFFSLISSLLSFTVIYNLLLKVN